MSEEEADLIIAEQNKSTEEILKAVAKVKSDCHELCKLKDMRIAELEAQIEKMKQDLDNARGNANKQEQWEIYSVLNDIYNDNFEVITSVSN